LHEGVADGGADELEAAFGQVPFLFALACGQTEV
jgi:hypothetical protein